MSEAQRGKLHGGRLSVSVTAASLICVLALGIASCGDPIADSIVAALGPEDPNVPRGPSHRPGQPCLACHRDGGNATAFSIAGTVYLDLATQKPAGNVAVIFIDSTNGTFTSTTNCAGNFYIKSDQYAPVYPMWVSMRAGSIRREMASPSFREGSCAGCHTDPRGPSSTGHVYLIDDPTVDIAPPSGCP